METEAFRDEGPNLPSDAAILGISKDSVEAQKKFADKFRVAFPLLADVDKIMTVLQANLTTVKIHGYVDDYKASIAAFSDVSSGLKQFLSGKVHESHR